MQTTSHGRFFTLRWVALSALGLAAGIALALAISDPVEAIVGMMLVTPVILAVSGSVFGACQWAAVWRRTRGGIWWIAATTVALGLGMTVGVVIVEVVGRAMTGGQVGLFTTGMAGRTAGLATIGAVTGLSVGVAQSLSVRRAGVELGRWPLRCAVAFGLGLPIGSTVAELLVGGLQNPIGFVTFLAVGGALIGALTARPAAQLST